MRTLILTTAALMALSTAASAQMGGGMGGGGMGGGMGGGGMGGHGGRGGHGQQEGGEGQRPGPPRAVKPLKREKLDKPVTAMFRAADANGDGIVTLDELRGVIEGRRDTQIRERFNRIDGDRNGQISLAEFTAWQKGMGSVAGSEDEARGTAGGPVPEVIAPELRDNEDSRALARLIEPLSATVLVAANTNYDAGMSLDELLAYERERFDAADTDHNGELSPDELRAVERPDERRLPRGPRDDDDGPRGGGRRPPPE